MIPIKVLCNCGAKYSFEVEPVNGQMPAPITCPKCGADGTPAANESIRLQLPATGTAAADSPAEAAAPSLVPKRPSGVRLRVAGSHANNEPTQTANPAEADAQAAPASPPVPAAVKRKRRRKSADDPEEDMGKFAIGVAGALVGAAIGAVLYYLIFDAGYHIKLVAVGVGGLTGLAGRYIGRQGSNELGMIAGALAIAAIFGAQYFVAKKWFFEADEKFMERLYSSMMETAKEAVAAVPNGTDEEIRKYLAKEISDEDEPVDPSEITAEEIASFKEEALPMYRDLADGKLTKDEWAKRFEDEDEPEDSAEQVQEDAAEEERTFKWIFLALTLSKFNLVCMAGAAGLAFKIGDS